jgi:hypothetical protein
MPFGFRTKPTEDLATARPASLFNPKKLDMISTANGVVSLFIVQDVAWTSSAAELASLGEKITTYVGFVLDGGLAAQYPALVGQPWRVIIDSYTGRPDAAAMEALNLTGDAVRGYGGDLIFHELAVPQPGATVPTTIRATRLQTARDPEETVNL